MYIDSRCNGINTLSTCKDIDLAYVCRPRLNTYDCQWVCISDLRSQVTSPIKHSKRIATAARVLQRPRSDATMQSTVLRTTSLYTKPYVLASQSNACISTVCMECCAVSETYADGCTDDQSSRNHRLEPCGCTHEALLQGTQTTAATAAHNCQTILPHVVLRP